MNIERLTISRRAADHAGEIFRFAGSFSRKPGTKRSLRRRGLPRPSCRTIKSLLHPNRHDPPGLHCQIAPNVQGKLVRVIKGAIWDVAVDLRRGSPTYGQYAAAELSAENWRQLWVPRGFLHGFCTLEPDTAVIYKVTAPYDRDAERAVIWNDPTLALPWPVAPENALLSEKDKLLPRLRDCEDWFFA